MSRFLARFSAISLTLWGLLHMAGGSMMWSAASNSDGVTYLQFAAPGASAADAVAIPAAVFVVLAARGIDIAWIGLVTAIFAVAFNWRNQSASWWVAPLVVVWTEFSLVVSTMVPGFMGIGHAWPGFLLAALGILPGVAARFVRGEESSN